MVSKHSELVKRQIRDRYGRFASPSSRQYTAPPPSCQEVGSSSCLRTAPPLTRLEEASSDSSSSSSDYNDECPHIKEVRSYELPLDFNCLV
jgi:hypothetical protein